MFKDIVNKENLAHRFDKIDSAGTSGFHVGTQPDSRTVALCRRREIPINHGARIVRDHDFYEFDYIFAMDKSNLRDLKDHMDGVKHPHKAKAKGTITYFNSPYNIFQKKKKPLPLLISYSITFWRLRVYRQNHNKRPLLRWRPWV